MNYLTKKYLQETRENLTPYKLYLLMVVSLEVILSIDGKKIELNKFVKDFLGGTLKGAVSTLSGIDSYWKELNIIIKK